MLMMMVIVVEMLPSIATIYFIFFFDEHCWLFLFNIWPSNRRPIYLFIYSEMERLIL